MKSTVLVTGGTGFLGAHAARALLRLGHRVVIFDSKAQVPEYVQPTKRLKMVQGDIQDWAHLARTVQQERVSDIVNTAAFLGPTGEKESLIWPMRTLRINTQAVWELLEICRFSRVRRLIHISSRAVYGEYNPEEGPTREESTPRPVAVYGASKVASDIILGQYRRHFGIDAVALRVVGLYGPGQVHHSPISDFVRAAVEGRAVHLPDGGDYLNEFTYIKDVVRAILLILEAPALDHSVYNVGVGHQDRLLEIAKVVQECVPAWKFSLGPGWLHDEPPRAAMSIGRISNELGYEPKFSLATGISEFVEWYRHGHYGVEATL